MSGRAQTFSLPWRCQQITSEGFPRPESPAGRADAAPPLLAALSTNWITARCATNPAPRSSQRILLSRDQECREHAYKQPVKAIDDVALENHPEVGPVGEHEAHGNKDRRNRPDPDQVNRPVTFLLPREE